VVAIHPRKPRRDRRRSASPSDQACSVPHEARQANTTEETRGSADSAPPVSPRSRSRRSSRRRLTSAVLAAALGAVSCTTGPPTALPPTAAGSPPSSLSAIIVTGRGIHKIKHVIMIVQENRSFDSYFGTYPGANGIPAKDGRFTVCVPDPKAASGCQRPYHYASLINGGGPYASNSSVADIDGSRGLVVDQVANAGCRIHRIAGSLPPDGPGDPRARPPWATLIQAVGHVPAARAPQLRRRLVLLHRGSRVRSRAVHLGPPAQLDVLSALSVPHSLDP
jgi:hypothetical protein